VMAVSALYPLVLLLAHNKHGVTSSFF
jgi:hypothetical protein